MSSWNAIAGRCEEDLTYDKLKSIMNQRKKYEVHEKVAMTLADRYCKAEYVG